MITDNDTDENAFDSDNESSEKEINAIKPKNQLKINRLCKINKTI